MRYIRLAMLLLACLAMPGAWGDIMPAPGQQGGYHRVRPTPLITSIEKSDVQIHLQSRQNTVVADVYGKFFLRCDSAPGVGGETGVEFPVNHVGQPGTTSFFRIAIDGKLWPSQHHQINLPSADTRQFQPCDSYSCWAIPVNGGKTTLIIVHYARVIPLLDGKAPFSYFGAQYARRGQERVHVLADKGLSLAIPAAQHMKPQRQTTREATWQVPAESTEQFQLIIQRHKVK